MNPCLQVFQQYAGILQQKYPDLSIRGDNFPPGGFRLQTAQILSVIKFLVIMMVLARCHLPMIWSQSVSNQTWLSFDPFACVGQPTPGWAQWLLDNKIYACMMTFFLFNGAFFSKQSMTWNNFLWSFSCWDSAYQHRSLWDYIEWHAGKSSKTSFSIWPPHNTLTDSMTWPPFSGLVKDWGWQNTSAWRTLPNHRESDEHEGDPAIVC